jgi:ubiquinone/menaquinone biosynthesis C-methylase UbiE
MDDTGWEQMADWWDHHLGDNGDLWHRTLIDPPVFKLVGDVAGQRVLDLACGNGYISRRFACVFEAWKLSRTPPR